MFWSVARDVNFTIRSAATPSPSPGTAVIYSNSAQQNRFDSNVSVYSGKRGCLRYDVGYGGAANVSIYDLFCTVFAGGVSPGIHINSTVGTSLVNFKTRS
ncbi:hypothetical protein M2171_005152 [Bradyrhizobium japonicum USDA 38]|nr:hypothetical protein [Bradyrhizobium japonicum USDA 38]MCS3948533.1 hypothetical protein [Bradyrhizobium japonicum]MCW2218642.1 hypothetical protein [Bradyrhizobium japonicum]MCW2343256.1 hypothetical protein [Bradyrhizobium japonicum]